MSRFNYDGGSDDLEQLLADGRYMGRRKKVLTGRPGRLALRELHRALVMMPHKRLIEGALCDGSAVCVMGAWLYRRYVDDGLTPKAAWGKLQDGKDRFHKFDSWEELERTIEKGHTDLGITRTLAEVVAGVNDEEAGWRASSPDERYELVLDWVREHMATPQMRGAGITAGKG